MFRYEEEIIRRSDRRVVGRMVTYGRGGGGDFPFTGSAASTFECPGVPERYAEIEKIFHIVND